MNQLNFPLLSILLILPAAGAILVALLPRNWESLQKWVALVTTLVVLLLSLALYFNFITGAPGFQFEEIRAWIPDLNISYNIGVDGISLYLVLLTTLLSAVAVLSSWRAGQRIHGPHAADGDRYAGCFRLP